ncbi:hypothetical protein NQT63_00380 [Pseudoalteromonas agarivorans]|uniref:hypothetical protein n=1 Tax=Pseudoalteromonas agarivorans TaxID=176102 RepID=UPI002118CC06|nr:hypothetical protein [Pseudoalteromonas agarivorans]MCQ8884147.1 hypothetical protein [Pseudoalteromonas agarivorans]
MKKILLTAVIFSSMSVLAKDTKVSDPFDLSASQSKVEELGVITKPDVDALEAKAKELFNTGNCKAALPVLIDYSKKSNWLANMISATLDPYYGASYDDRKSYSYAKLKPLIPMESMANDYKKKRNIAFAMQGECLVKVGDKKGAIPVLLKALDLIDLENDVWWERTRNNLLSVIEVQAP